MHFDNINHTQRYLPEILYIIRKGIKKKSHLLRKSEREGINTQILVETFNIIGTTDPSIKLWIGVQKEHERKDGTGREDVYFHLNDDQYTRVFFIEAKRLPKYRTQDDDEYIAGDNFKGRISGGIQRYKALLHGNANLRYNGMIAYVENKSIPDWLALINHRLSDKYPKDTQLISNGFSNEFQSTHIFDNNEENSFSMHHFWISLV